MGESVLTLETIEPDRDFIEIDGTKYQLRNNDELGLAELSKLKRISTEIVDRKIDANFSEEDIRALEEASNTTLAIILIDLPDEVRDKLNSVQKVAIVNAFTAVASKKRAEQATEETGGSPKITGDSSPGSVDSTGASSPTG